MTASIAVVITNFNRCDDLRQALLSIRRQDYPAAEILVVDNASQDSSREMVTDEFPEVVLIQSDENLGMSGYSLGFTRASSELLFQMDNDSLIPDTTVLGEVARRFEYGPENLAVVACRVEEWRPEIDDVEEFRAREQRRGPINTGGFHSGGVGFRKALLDEVGYYHREIFLYGSELFLQMKLLAKGFTIAYFPEILMLHKSSGVARSPVGLYYELRNRYWFMRRFASTSQRWRFLPSMLVYDAAYTLANRKPNAFFNAVSDGFGSMPSDLRQPLNSSLPNFQAKVEEVGSRFGLGALLRSISHLRHT